MGSCAKSRVDTAAERAPGLPWSGLGRKLLNSYILSSEPSARHRQVLSKHLPTVYSAFFQTIREVLASLPFRASGWLLIALRSRAWEKSFVCVVRHLEPSSLDQDPASSRPQFPYL